MVTGLESLSAPHLLLHRIMGSGGTLTPRPIPTTSPTLNRPSFRPIGEARGNRGITSCTFLSHTFVRWQAGGGGGGVHYLGHGPLVQREGLLSCGVVVVVVVGSPLHATRTAC